MDLKKTKEEVKTLELENKKIMSKLQKVEDENDQLKVSKPITI